MKLFRTISIATRLRWIVTLAISLALVFACIGFLVYDNRAFRSAEVVDVNTLAEVIGSNSTGALSFQDAKSAEDILSALSFKKHILEACIYDSHGRPFAKYVPADVNRDFVPPPIENDTSYFPNSRTLVVFRDILFAGDRIGTIYFRYDLAELAVRRLRYIQMMGLVALTALLLALLLSSYLQRSITNAIHTLARATREVSECKEYSMQVVKENDDEVGELIDGFNEMLAQIRQRDQVLEDARKITETTNQLLSAQARDLGAARDTAEEASRAKSIFLANMSHELRTPLNAILGYAQLLKRDRTLARWQLNAANTIQQSGEHLLMLITDILDLHKIEAGKIDLELAPVAMPAFLNGIASIIRVKAEEKAINFRCDIATSLPAFVLTDQKRLRQVLLNLLSNAIKFTDRGDVELRVKVLSESEGQVRLLFEVQDSGIGIPARALEKIFQPFEQVSDERHRSGGTGLGLSISQTLVGLMGSEIRVESVAERGSTFSFDMIARKANNQPTHPKLDGEVIGYRGPRKKVLVVDDIEANRLVLTQFLESVGFEVSQAVNGLEALSAAQAIKPDLVFMDVRMPVMDGLEAIQRMQKTPDLQMIPVVGISAGVGEREQADCMAAGAKGLLGKPIQDTCIFGEMGRLLDLSWMHEASETSSIVGDQSALFLVPSMADLEALRESAKEGNMRAIREKASDLMALDAQFQPFADKIIELALGYQSKALLRLMEKYTAQRQMEIMEKL
jgi:signal transduction histidine kinase/CheY-like chemotaxis protein